MLDRATTETQVATLPSIERALDDHVPTIGLLTRRPAVALESRGRFDPQAVGHDTMLPVFRGQENRVALEFKVDEADHAHSPSIIKLGTRDQLHERRTPEDAALRAIDHCTGEGSNTPTCAVSFKRLLGSGLIAIPNEN